MHDYKLITSILGASWQNVVTRMLYCTVEIRFLINL